MSVKTAVTTLILAGVSYVEASASISQIEVSVSAVSSSPAVYIEVASGSPTVKFVEPVFEAIYVQPKFETRYLEVDVLAVPSKPAVIQVDVVNPLDNTLFGVTKRVPDTITPSDTQKVGFSGVLDDQIYLGDIFVPLKFINRLFTDDFTTPDANTIGYAAVKENFVTAGDDYYADLVKALSNFVTATDTDDITFGKNITDPQPVTDDYFSEFSKVEAETLVSSDTFDRVLSFVRAVNSSVAMLELAQASYNKAETDQVTASELQVFDFFSAKTNSVNPLETLSSTTVFLRSFVNSLAASDSVASAINKAFNHSVTVFDSTQVQVDFVRTPTENITFNETFVSVFPVLRNFSDVATMNAYLSEVNQSPLNTFVVGGKLGGESIIIALARIPDPLTDSTGTADSGLWVLQDYTSADYFAQDYVGTKGTI
jgi:hypothetical protein